MIKVKKSFIDMEKRVRSLDSLSEFCKVMLCDYGITYSPTTVTEQELGYYLLNELRLHGFEDFRSVRTGIPHILDIDYLYYVLERVPSEDSFYVGLTYTIGYLEAKEELKAMYSANGSLNVHAYGTTASRNYTVRKIKKKDKLGKPIYTVRDIVSRYNSLQGDVVEVIPISDVFYKYFEQVTGYFNPDKWVFFDGKTRKSEVDLLKFVFEGHIKPTAKGLSYYWNKYLEHLDKNGVTVYDELEMFIERSQQGVFNSYLYGVSNYELKYFNSFSVGLTNKYSIHKEYPVYLTNIAWDSVLDRPLPVENQLNGVGGEFVYSPVNSDDRPFEVIYHDGRRVLMYKLSSNSKINSKQLNLVNFYSRLSSLTYGYGQVNDRKLFRIDSNNRAFVLGALSQMEKEGLYCVNKAK